MGRMSQIPVNSVPTETVEMILGTDRGKFSSPFIRFFQDVLRRVNLWSAVVSTQVVNDPIPATIVMNATTGLIYLKPVGVVAALTVTFPDLPQDGLIVTIKTTQSITALTLATTSPIVILDPVTTLAANGVVRYLYVLSENQWIRIT